MLLLSREKDKGRESIIKLQLNFLNFLNRNNSGQGCSGKLIGERINFPPIPYILKSEFHETFIPSTFSRHVTTFTDRLCYSHSDRIRFASNLSLPPPPRHRRISSRWRKRGIRLEATDTPDSFLLILSVLRYASNVCAVPPFHAFLSLFPLNFSSFFSFEARTQLLENRRSTPPLFPFSL